MAKIFSVFPIELKPGVSDAEVEAFMRDPQNERYNPPGMTWHFAKADRGERKGKYAFILEFESVETRDHIMPIEDSAPADKYTQERFMLLFAAMDKLISFTFSGDYISIG